MVTIKGLPAAAVRMMGLTGAQVKIWPLHKHSHARVPTCFTFVFFPFVNDCLSLA